MSKIKYKTINILKTLSKFKSKKIYNLKNTKKTSNNSIFNNKQNITFFIILFIITTISILGFFKYKKLTYSKNSFINNSNKIEVHYIDVGQGDSILIKVNNKNILIDSGSKKSSSKIFSHLRKENIKKFDYIIATHPHEDHIGNMDKILDKYTVSNFYAPKKLSNTTYFKSMVKSLKRKNLKINIANSDKTIDLGLNCYGKFLAPKNTTYDNINNYSAVLKICYKDSIFIFTGDAECLSEDEILDKYKNLQCDVLKLGHHGSSTSTSDNFLDQLSPKIAIISCGKNNRYGHPSKKTIKKLKKRKIRTYRTDIDGTIILTSDGKNIYKK